MSESIERARGDVSDAEHALRSVLEVTRQPRSSKTVLTIAGAEALKHLCVSRTKLSDLERRARYAPLGGRAASPVD